MRGFLLQGASCLLRSAGLLPSNDLVSSVSQSRTPGPPSAAMSEAAVLGVISDLLALHAELTNLLNLPGTS